MNQPLKPHDKSLVVATVVQPLESSITGAAGGPRSSPSPWIIQGPFIQYPGGIVIGNPLAGNLGNGSINCTAIFVNGVAVTAVPATVLPLMDGTAAIGVSSNLARQDHVHPSDTSRAPTVSPTFTGVPIAPTASPGNNSTQLATTAYVAAAVSASTTGVASYNGRTGTVVPIAADLTALGGAPLASPTFTGVPIAPNATLGTNTQQLATTAFVQSAVVGAGVASYSGRVGAVVPIAADLTAMGGAPLASPAFTGVPTTASTPTAGDSTTKLATTAFIGNALASPPAGSIGSGAAVGGTIALKVSNGVTAPTAGQIGETITSGFSGTVTVSTSNKNVTSIVLTAGIWDVWSTIACNTGSSGTVFALFAWLSSTSTGSTPLSQDVNTGLLINLGNTETYQAPIGRTTIITSVSMTIYLVASIVNSVGSGNTYQGIVSARRVA
jgi:hypothetical protein